MLATLLRLLGLLALVGTHGLGGPGVESTPVPPGDPNALYAYA